MASNDNELAQLENCLQRLLQPNTEVIRQAGTEINQRLKLSSCIGSLCHLMQTSNDPGIQQMCAVLTRKKIVGHWGELSSAVKEGIQQLIFDILMKDQASVPRRVRRCVADLAAVVARLTLPYNQWGQLLEFVFQSTQAQSAVHRECGIYLFQLMMDSDILCTILQPNFATLHEVLRQALIDQDPQVRAAALAGVSSFTNFLDSDEVPEEQWNALFSLLEPCVNVMRFALEQGDSDAAAPGFAVFEFVERYRIDLLSNVLNDIVKMMLLISSNIEYDLGTRQKALFFVEHLIDFKPKTFVELNLVDAVLDVVFPMCAEEEEDDEVDVLTAHKFAAQIIDSVCKNIPERYVWDPVMRRILGFIHSPEGSERRAAITALATCIEGMADRVEANMDEFLPFLLNAAHDPLWQVRQAAFIAIGELCKNLEDVIGQYKNELAPLLAQGLGDADRVVVETSCYAVQYFCQALKGEISQYLEGILSRVHEVLQRSDLPPATHELAVCCISSCALSAEQEFRPFYQPVMETLQVLIRREDEDGLGIKARALESCALVACAIGPEEFQPYFLNVVNIAISSLQIEDQTLQEHCFNCLANLSEEYKEAFVPYLEHVVPRMIDTINSSDGIIVRPEVQTSSELDGVIEQDAIDLLQIDANVRLQFIASYMDAKAAAISGLGSIAVAVGAAFNPYIEAFMESLPSQVLMVDTKVRAAITEAYGDIAIYLCTASNFEYTPGGEAKSNPLPEEIQDMADIILATMVSRLADEEVEIVSLALESIGKLAKSLGPAAIDKGLDQVISMINTIFERDAPCQTCRESFDDSDTDTDFQLFNTATECLVSLAHSAGVAIIPFIKDTQKLFTELLQPEGHMDYVTIAIGTIGELSAATKEAYQAYTYDMLAPATGCLHSEDPFAQRNGVYAVGNMCRYGGEVTKEVLPDVLNQLGVLYQKDIEDLAVRDNIAGAFAGILLGNMSILPVKDILPIILQSLPLKSDLEPSNVIYECIFKLLCASDPTTLSHIPQLIGLFSVELIRNKELTEETQQNMVSALRQFMQQSQKDVEAIVNSLDFTPEEHAQLQQHFQ